MGTAEDPPGVLIARGRSADVFAVGSDRVLRRYRSDRDVVTEAATMAHVARHGYPVPAVHDADGRDIVMDRVEGPTMLSYLTRRPWALRHQARVLAGLQARLETVPIGALDLPPAWAAESVIVHGDHHPDNVLLSPSGPVVIDWTNAYLGPSGSDAATTWCLLHAADAPVSGRVGRVVTALGRGLLLQAFLAASDRAAARAALPAVVERRLDDHNLSPGEKQRMIDLLRRA
jgi:aminoglycoside phosphotransferase (APT) family kinase protein